MANAIKLKRCKSTGSVLCNKSTNQQDISSNEQKHVNGIPWRTAARANRQSSAHQRQNHHYTLIDHEEDMLMMMHGDESKHLSGISELDATNNLLSNFINSSNAYKSGNHNLSNNNANANNTLNLNVSNKELIQIIQREKESKSELEYFIMEVNSIV